MITLDGLRAFGANVDEGMTRCLNNEAFYLKMVGKGLEDARFSKLADTLAAKNYDEAFEMVHALKGVISNLALTPLLTPIQEMTELLRSRTDTDYSALCKEVTAKRDELLAM